MFFIQLFNKISKTGLSRFDETRFSISENAAQPDAILLRSHSLHGAEIPSSVMAIGRAGAGTNNIPLDACTEKAVVVFNTPGANANAVKEMVLAGLFLGARNILAGVQYAATLTGTDAEISREMEKSKSHFAGTEISGKRLGVIGLGAIGTMVANAAIALGMQVEGYDPFISVDWAWTLSSQVSKAASLEKMLKNCDYITVHVPLNEHTRGLINAAQLKHLKKGACVLNFARDEIVVEQDVQNILESEQMRLYITDFPTKKLLGHKSVISIPHLGASTREAEENCAVMIADQVQDFLLNGNIRNSVNYPDCVLDNASPYRLAISNENVPNMVGQITGVLAKYKLNIAEMVNKSRGKIAYTLVDFSGDLPKGLVDEIQAIQGILRCRLLTF